MNIIIGTVIIGSLLSIIAGDTIPYVENDELTADILIRSGDGKSDNSSETESGDELFVLVEPIEIENEPKRCAQKKEEARVESDKKDLFVIDLLEDSNDSRNRTDRVGNDVMVEVINRIDDSGSSTTNEINSRSDKKLDWGKLDEAYGKLKDARSKIDFFRRVMESLEDGTNKTKKVGNKMEDDKKDDSKNKMAVDRINIEDFNNLREILENKIKYSRSLGNRTDDGKNKMAEDLKKLVDAEIQIDLFRPIMENFGKKMEDDSEKNFWKKIVDANALLDVDDETNESFDFDENIDESKNKTDDTKNKMADGTDKMDDTKNKTMDMADKINDTTKKMADVEIQSIDIKNKMAGIGDKMYDSINKTADVQINQKNLTKKIDDVKMADSNRRFSPFSLSSDVFRSPFSLSSLNSQRTELSSSNLPESSLDDIDLSALNSQKSNEISSLNLPVSSSLDDYKPFDLDKYLNSTNFEKTTRNDTKKLQDLKNYIDNFKVMKTKYLNDLRDNIKKIKENLGLDDSIKIDENFEVIDRNKNDSEVTNEAMKNFNENDDLEVRNDDLRKSFDDNDDNIKIIDESVKDGPEDFEVRERFTGLTEQDEVNKVNESKNFEVIETSTDFGLKDEVEKKGGEKSEVVEPSSGTESPNDGFVGGGGNKSKNFEVMAPSADESAVKNDEKSKNFQVIDENTKNHVGIIKRDDPMKNYKVIKSDDSMKNTEGENIENNKTNSLKDVEGGDGNFEVMSKQSDKKIKRENHTVRNVDEYVEESDDKFDRNVKMMRASKNLQKNKKSLKNDEKSDDQVSGYYDEISKKIINDDRLINNQRDGSNNLGIDLGTIKNITRNLEDHLIESDVFKNIISSTDSDQKDNIRNLIKNLMENPQGKSQNPQGNSQNPQEKSQNSQGKSQNPQVSQNSRPSQNSQAFQNPQAPQEHLIKSKFFKDLKTNETELKTDENDSKTKKTDSKDKFIKTDKDESDKQAGKTRNLLIKTDDHIIESDVFKNIDELSSSENSMVLSKNFKLPNDLNDHPLKVSKDYLEMFRVKNDLKECIRKFIEKSGEYFSKNHMKTSTLPNDLGEYIKNLINRESNRIEVNPIGLNGINSNEIVSKQTEPNGIVSEQFIPNGIGSNQIDSNRVVSKQFYPNGIGSNQFDSNGIVSNPIVSNGIVSNSMGANGIASNPISPNEILLNLIGSNGIVSKQFYPNGIGSNQINLNEILSNLIGSNGIVSNPIGSNGIISNHLRGSNGLLPNNFGPNRIILNPLQSNGIGSNPIGSNGIGSNGIESNGIVSNGNEWNKIGKSIESDVFKNIDEYSFRNGPGDRIKNLGRKIDELEGLRNGMKSDNLPPSLIHDGTVKGDDHGVFKSTDKSKRGKTNSREISSRIRTEMMDDQNGKSRKMLSTPLDTRRIPSALWSFFSYGPLTSRRLSSGPLVSQRSGLLSYRVPSGPLASRRSSSEALVSQRSSSRSLASRRSSSGPLPTRRLSSKFLGSQSRKFLAPLKFSSLGDLPGISSLMKSPSFGPSPMGSPSFGSSPMEYPDLDPSLMESLPLGPSPMGSPPLGPSSMGSPPLGSSPMGSPPLGSSPMGSPPLGPSRIDYPALDPSLMGSPPLGPSPMDSLPSEPSPMDYSSLNPSLMESPPLGPSRMESPSIESLEYPLLNPPESSSLQLPSLWDLINSPSGPREVPLQLEILPPKSLIPSVLGPSDSSPPEYPSIPSNPSDILDQNPINFDQNAPNLELSDQLKFNPILENKDPIKPEETDPEPSQTNPVLPDVPKSPINSDIETIAINIYQLLSKIAQIVEKNNQNLPDTPPFSKLIDLVKPKTFGLNSKTHESVPNGTESPESDLNEPRTHDSDLIETESPDWELNEVTSPESVSHEPKSPEWNLNKKTPIVWDLIKPKSTEWNLNKRKLIEWYLNKLKSPEWYLNKPKSIDPSINQPNRNELKPTRNEPESLEWILNQPEGNKNLSKLTIIKNSNGSNRSESNGPGPTESNQPKWDFDKLVPNPFVMNTLEKKSRTNLPDMNSFEMDSSETKSPDTDSFEMHSNELDNFETNSSETDSFETNFFKLNFSRTDFIKTNSSETSSVNTNSSEMDSFKTNSSEMGSFTMNFYETSSFNTNSSKTGSFTTNFPEMGSFYTNSTETVFSTTNSQELNSRTTLSVEPKS